MAEHKAITESKVSIGAFSIIGQPRYKTQANTIELWALNVHPSVWRQGLGSGLINHAIGYAKAAGFQTLELWCIKGNHAAEKAYVRAGFTLSGQERRTTQLAGIAIHEHQYTLSLS